MCLAIPGRVITLAEPEGADPSPLLRTGRVDFGGVVKDVNMAYVPEARVGDYVVVHVGFAISTMDEAEANQVFEYLRQMEEAGELGPTEVPATL
jgi:hydrogenase expression/formation protein HypC